MIKIQDNKYNESRKRHWWQAFESEKQYTIGSNKE